ncbi:MAG TPA: amidohydrolase family protein, partial [Candidatus Binatia bacterium]|nr:amidohydrolase family protein [Candidatus Binatia bacterium]
METTAWRLYSCDDHLDLWNLPRDVWGDRLPARLRDRAPRVVESGVGAWWTCDGSVIGMYGLQGPMKGYSAISRAGIEDDGLRASNPKLRLEDMDRDGVWASVVYGPNLFGLPIQDPELKAASLAAYNDWAAIFNQYDPARLSVLPVLPTHAPDAAAAELERVAGAGHRGAIISPFEFRCSDPAWERFWDVAEAVGLPVSFHIGQGTSQVRVAPGSWELAAFSAVGPMQLDEPLAMMVYSGVLERHPKLRLVLAESGIGWLPYFVSRLDAAA